METVAIIAGLWLLGRMFSALQLAQYRSPMATLRRSARCIEIGWNWRSGGCG
jgi:hypothetical protein